VTTFTAADVLEASQRLADAKEAHATAFLRAKISSKNPTDRQAEASAQIEAGQELQAAEADYFITQHVFVAALRRGEV
jgi:hypothetical protein